MPESRERIYYQGDVLEECRTGRVYVVKRTGRNELELLPGCLHSEFGYFVQDPEPVPVKTPLNPTGFRACLKKAFCKMCVTISRPQLFKEQENRNGKNRFCAHLGGRQ